MKDDVERLRTQTRKTIEQCTDAVREFRRVSALLHADLRRGSLELERARRGFGKGRPRSPQ